jgi:hypothetical protein
MGDMETQLSRLGECPTCGPHTVGEGIPNGVDCACGRHFHFGDALWTRTDPCIVCPACERALSPLDFDQQGVGRLR